MAMPSLDGANSRGFLPKLEASLLQSTREPLQPPDSSNDTAIALEPWSITVAEAVYPPPSELWIPAPVPIKPTSHRDRYLAPFLTKNERLRLATVSYYMCGALEDAELLSLLQGKLQMICETVGWEFVVASFVSSCMFLPIVNHGLDIASISRRESLCAHTINQNPGAVFILSDISQDWRFRDVPVVKNASISAYAGVPLIFDTESGEKVALGTLFVASSIPQEPLSKQLQVCVVRMASWIVTDIVYSARVRRERDRQRMQFLLWKMQDRCTQDDANMEEEIVHVLQDFHPLATVNLQIPEGKHIQIDDGVTISASELQRGLWEDGKYIESLIIQSNHKGMIAPRLIRIVVARCEHTISPYFLFVGTRDCSVVFDDVNVWFVSSCAALLCWNWQSRALKIALATRETFWKDVTHQLRTPIHGILGLVQIIAEDLQDQHGAPPDLQKKLRLDLLTIVESITTCAKDLSAIVNDLITLSRCADQDGTQRTVEVHTLKAIELTLKNNVDQSMPESVSNRPSIIISYQLPQSCDALVLDLGLFVNSILPITRNAIQHAPGGIITLTISVSEDFQFLRVDIEDDGESIDESHHKRILNGHSDNEKDTDRAGLGFALSSRLCAMMEGTLSLESSQLGNGAHFSAVYRDPIPACTLNARRPGRRLSKITPSHVYVVHADLQESPIDNSFRKFLVSLGYILSDVECLLMILPFVSDCADLIREVARVQPTQAGICLASEAAYMSKFQDSYVHRDGNVVYVRSPFVSSTLEQALCDAADILKEIEIAVGNSYHRRQLPQAIHEKTSEFSDGAPEPCAKEEQTVPTAKVPHQNLRKTCSPPVLQRASSSNSQDIIALLVDDNDLNLRLLQMFCDRRGISYQTAKNGEDAVRYFSEQSFIAPDEPQSPHTLDPPVPLDSKSIETTGNRKQDCPLFDLILMDVQMPQCNGIEATRRIRSIEKELNIPKAIICIISGQDHHGDRAAATEAEADDYLVKPVTPRTLASWIKSRFPHADF